MSFNCLSNLDKFQICITIRYMYKTKYALLHHVRTYTCTIQYNTIGIGSTCMNKVQARIAQSVEPQTTILKVISESHCGQEFFIMSFVLLSMRSFVQLSLYN